MAITALEACKRAYTTLDNIDFSKKVERVEQAIIAASDLGSYSTRCRVRYKADLHPLLKCLHQKGFKVAVEQDNAGAFVLFVRW